MGILEDQLNSVFGSETVFSPYAGEDFKEGFVISEIIDGAESEERRLALTGKFMPHVPFEVGTEQALTKEYYAGQDQPTVQVMGVKEAPLVVKGRMRSKNLNSDQYNLAEKYRDALDAMCRRGNILKIQLGEWYRYAFLEKVTFPMKSRSDMEYTLEFFVVGRTLPTFDITSEVSFGSDFSDELTGLSDELKAETALQVYKYKTTVFDVINKDINKVAGMMKTVTDFVDGALADVDNLVFSAKRALGLIKYARVYMSRTARRINFLATDVASLPGSAVAEHEKAIASLANATYAIFVRESMAGHREQLAALQKRFEALSHTVPYRRHLVRVGDTLQKLAIKYYNDATKWQKIYDHNELKTTDLVIGSVLEIPKL